MIIMRLKGGLGNQLFQYATGRRLAWWHHVPLAFDLSLYANDPFGRSYKLDKFQLSGRPATAEEIAAIAGLGMSLPQRLRRKLRQWTRPYYRQPLVQECVSHFDPAILRVGPSALLDGYWQSERYFIDCAELIRQELQVRTPLPQNAALAEYIRHVAAVSVHIRRADYLTHPQASQRFPVCTPEYYIRAISRICAVVPLRISSCFPTKMDWVRQHLSFPGPVTYVDGNGAEADYEDLRLMSLCQHHIIANSSFSWWGAWLACPPRQCVIAPSTWFYDRQLDTSDLIPAAWERL